MSTITILQPKEPKNLYPDFLRSNSNENKRILKVFKETPYQNNITVSANSSFTKNFTWEYFSNELEFE